MFFRDTLNLVLQGEWPGLARATKTHLLVTLTRCASSLAKHPSAPKYESLIEIIKEPWGHPTIKRIIDNEVANIEEGINCVMRHLVGYCLFKFFELVVF